MPESITYRILVRALNIFFRDFVELDLATRQELLSGNERLFVQLYIAFYLLITSSAEQMDFISRTSSPSREKLPPNEWTSPPLDLHQFNSLTGMFKANADLSYYNDLLTSLRNLKLTSCHAKANLEKFAALAFVVLFNDVAEDPTKDCPIKRELKLKRERLFDNYVDEGSNEGLGDFISTLSRMAAFYDIYQNRKEPNHVLSPVCSG